jgi:hypothetical protein
LLVGGRDGSAIFRLHFSLEPVVVDELFESDPHTRVGKIAVAYLPGDQQIVGVIKAAGAPVRERLVMKPAPTLVRVL